MVDILEQINYWKNGAVEDLQAAEHLINGNKVRHGLFFAHLSLEKILKAHVCKTTGKIAPKLHNLVRLSEAASLTPSGEITDFLAEMNQFNLEGRYPVPRLPEISIQEAKEYMKTAKEVLAWYSRQL
ncbi:MAG: HEPN domain protein [Planctomycetes bacterium ADurb.Bin401]|nr:MAG: HEPN domain protein [Planctomycetes bacterium ADurb.Bin401]